MSAGGTFSCGRRTYEWRPVPSASFSWGYIPLQGLYPSGGEALWFRTKRAADTYGAGRGPHILARALELPR